MNDEHLNLVQRSGGRTEMENRYYVVARATPDGICEVSVSTRSLAEAQQKRHRIVENTQDPGYFVAYADIPEPQWQRL